MTRKACEDYFSENLLKLSSNEVLKLCKRFKKSIDFESLGLKKVRVAILSSYLTDFLIESLYLLCARRGIELEVYQAPYGFIEGEVLDPNSGLFEFAPDIMIVLPTYRDVLWQDDALLSAEENQKKLESEFKRWSSIWGSFSGHIIQASFDIPPFRSLGELDGIQIGGRVRYNRDLNNYLFDKSPNNVNFIDTEFLISRVGFSKWSDNNLYSMSKQPFTFEGLLELSDTISSKISGLFGKSKKLLILDLDNTLWGGVIGDDGLNGIKLGIESAEGQSFSEFQSYVKSLHSRGVILAVCSKNQDELARQPFLEHSASVLGLEDFSVFTANFKDKAGNIKEIVNSLNIGFDSVVFVDDSPVECRWVKDQLPEVSVINLPINRPSDYIKELDQFNFFNSSSITLEDINRNKSYKSREKTIELQSQSESIDDFLKNLKAEVIVKAVDGSSSERIVQLVSKTNQFKFNPNIISENDLKEGTFDVLSLSFKDVLQEYGIVSVSFFKVEKSVLEISNWVMSCRVFGRRLEALMLDLLIKEAKKKNIPTVGIQYIETKKNKILPKILEGIGFNRLSEDRFELSVDSYELKSPHYITLT